MSKSRKVFTDIEPSADEKQAVLEDLMQANQIRRNAQMPQYDIRYEYSRKLTLLRQDNYRTLLEPYIQSYLKNLPTLGGFVGRMVSQIQAEQKAAEQLYTVAGIPPVAGAFPSFTDRMISSFVKQTQSHSR